MKGYQIEKPKSIRRQRQMIKVDSFGNRAKFTAKSTAPANEKQIDNITNQVYLLDLETPFQSVSYNKVSYQL